MIRGVSPGARRPDGPDQGANCTIVGVSTLVLPAIVLAAGRSSRMGEPKAALRLPGGHSFLGNIARALVGGGASPIVVVVSPDDRAAGAALPSELETAVRWVINPDPSRGQLSSLQRGLQHLVDAPAVVVTLVDVPLIDAGLVGALVDAWIGSGAPLVRPARAGRHGHPMVVAPPLTADLLAADPGASARDLVRAYAARGIELQMEDDGPFLDVDTPDEYQRLVGRLQSRH